MARTTVEYRIDEGRVISVVGPQADAAAYRAAQAARGRAISNIRRLGRVDTGEMIAGMQVRRAIGASMPLFPRYDVSSTAKHTVFQELGTRAHGPRNASRMVFRPKGSSKVVYAKWVRGVTPGYFMRDAARDTRASDFLP